VDFARRVFSLCYPARICDTNLHVKEFHPLFKRPSERKAFSACFSKSSRPQAGDRVCFPRFSPPRRPKTFFPRSPNKTKKNKKTHFSFSVPPFPRDLNEYRMFFPVFHSTPWTQKASLTLVTSTLGFSHRKPRRFFSPLLAFRGISPKFFPHIAAPVLVMEAFVPAPGEIPPHLPNSSAEWSSVLVSLLRRSSFLVVIYLLFPFEELGLLLKNRGPVPENAIPLSRNRSSTACSARPFTNQRRDIELVRTWTLSP